MSRDWGPGWTKPRRASPVGRNNLLHRFDAVFPYLQIPDADQAWGWSRHAVAIGTSLRPDGRPQHRTMSVILSRQNAKTTAMQVLAVVYACMGLRVAFALHERVKGREKWLEVAEAIERICGKQLCTVNKSYGREHVDCYGPWADGRKGRVRLITPDGPGARSDTFDVVLVDEAAFVRPEFFGAVRPTMVTRPRSQTWNFSSAGTDKSVSLAEARRAALDQLRLPAKRRTAGLIEWQKKAGDNYRDERVWHQNIPTLGHRGGADIDALRDDVASMTKEEFEREYLGVWSTRQVDNPLSAEVWDAIQVDALPPPGELRNRHFGIDRSPDQSHASIAFAAWHPETSKIVVALVHYDREDGWVPREVRRLARELRPMGVRGDRYGAGHHEQRLAGGHYQVDLTGPMEMAQACAGFVALANDGLVSVRRHDLLTDAALSAERRDIADVGWAFKKRNEGAGDISPLVSGVLAVQGVVLSRPGNMSGDSLDSGAEAETVEPQAENG